VRKLPTMKETNLRLQLRGFAVGAETRQRVAAQNPSTAGLLPAIAGVGDDVTRRADPSASWCVRPTLPQTALNIPEHVRQAVDPVAEEPWP